MALAFIACDKESIISISPSETEVSSTGGEFVFQLKATAPWTAASDADWIEVSPLSGTSDATVTIRVSAASTTLDQESTVTFTMGDKSALLTVRQSGIELDPGVLVGIFSVSETRRVRFSQGNLQYRASSRTWRFAENQYDLIGSGNNNISETYDGWIDLFGWGASGFDNRAQDAWYVYFQPWSHEVMSLDIKDAEFYNVTGYGPSGYNAHPDDPLNFTLVLRDLTDNSDWGYNAISNGGNEPDLWRTLTENEWKYLFQTRVNAADKFGHGSVEGVHGIILLPDAWTLPSGMSFTTVMQDWQRINIYTSKDWAKMQAAGAVFLPAAGDRGGSQTGNYDSSTSNAYGYYWSSTARDISRSYYVCFYDNFVSATADMSNSHEHSGLVRSTGMSVRLVIEMD